MRAGVIGSPISHSLSPFIFNFIARAENYPIDYQSFEVKADESKKFLQTLKHEKDFLGLNVTLPLKELFLEEIDFISPEVRALGALNVLHFKGSELRGFNTDVIGIQKTLEDKKFLVKGKTCFLLGAGGSAKAVAYVLGSLGASNVLVFNRSERSSELVLKFTSLFTGTKWHAINSLQDEQINKLEIDLIINSTPLGMSGKDSGVELFKSLGILKFSNDALAFDLIYTPEQTDFLNFAGSMRLRTVGGLGMLIEQALATWKIWIGDLKNEKELHLRLKDFLNGILKLRLNPNPIYVTGFMGVGKSSVGGGLSTFLGRAFLDTDRMIEASAQLKIPEIFSLKGETFFRDLEHTTILGISTSSSNSVVALGGGALMNRESLEAIVDSGFLVYLSADKKTLIERITNQNQDRPMLSNLSISQKDQKISELLRLRLADYQKAGIHIPTDHLNIQDVIYEIVSAIGKMKEGSTL